MSEHDEKLDRAYRALAKEEPPAALDAAILAASRRAVARPSLARRWAVPVSLAATLVLVVGVTLEMQRERPDVAVSLPEKKGAMSLPQAAPESAETAPVAPEASTLAAPEAQPSAAPRAKRQEAEVPREAKDRAQSAPTRARPAPEARQKTERFAPPPAPPAEAAPVAPPAPAPPSAAIFSAKRAAGANVAADVAQPADPHQALERIAKLRAQGRDEEADRALEAFRKRYPDYRIDEAMWARVKPR